MLSYSDIVYDTASKMSLYLARAELPWNEASTGDYLPVNIANGHQYLPLNALRLLVEAKRKNFSSNRWMTIGDVERLSIKVKYKERSTALVFWKEYEKDYFDYKSRRIVKRPFLAEKNLRVFNLDQLELPNYFPARRPHWKTVEKAMNSYINRCGIKIVEGTAGYNRNLDVIEIPRREEFSSRNQYYDLLLWNLIRATEHSGRLCRVVPNNETLISRELFRCAVAHKILAGRLGIPTEEFRDPATSTKMAALLKDNYMILSNICTESEAIVRYFS